MGPETQRKKERERDCSQARGVQRGPQQVQGQIVPFIAEVGWEWRERPVQTPGRAGYAWLRPRHLWGG